MTFAVIGLELGPEAMQAQAQAFGFCPTDPPTETSCIEPTMRFRCRSRWVTSRSPAYFEQNDPLLAFSSIGLDNVITNPLHMALVGGAIANGGVMMEPRLVREIRDPQGQVIREFDPSRSTAVRSPTRWPPRYAS